VRTLVPTEGVDARWPRVVSLLDRREGSFPGALDGDDGDTARTASQETFVAAGARAEELRYASTQLLAPSLPAADANDGGVGVEGGGEGAAAAATATAVARTPRARGAAAAAPATPKALSPLQTLRDVYGSAHGAVQSRRVAVFELNLLNQHPAMAALLATLDVEEPIAMQVRCRSFSSSLFCLFRGIHFTLFAQSLILPQCILFVCLIATQERASKAGSSAAVPWHVAEIRTVFAQLSAQTGAMLPDVNGCLLILRVVLNRPTLFAPEAKLWLPLLLDFLELLEQRAAPPHSRGVHYVLYDVVQLFVRARVDEGGAAAASPAASASDSNGAALGVEGGHDAPLWAVLHESALLGVGAWGGDATLATKVRGFFTRLVVAASTQHRMSRDQADVYVEMVQVRSSFLLFALFFCSLHSFVLLIDSFVCRI
jgi:hypothetical protein